MWLLIITGVIGVAAYFLLRGPTDKSALAKGAVNRHMPGRSLNPIEVKNQAGVVVWEFLTPNLSTACVFARNSAGTRKNAKDCIALPLADCKSENCACHYRPVYESRKAQRRHTASRRESIRFDTAEERRATSERRKDQMDWQENRFD